MANDLIEHDIAESVAKRADENDKSPVEVTSENEIATENIEELAWGESDQAIGGHQKKNTKIAEQEDHLF